MKPISIFNLTPPGKRLVVHNKFPWNHATMTYEEARILLIGNMIVEYASNDIFGDFWLGSQSLRF
jgi:hypothetical protein